MSAYDVGGAIEARYKELGLTQEHLAAAAGVSNSTVRNVLRGRVSEARTWPAIERALGWRRGSLELLQAGRRPESILPTSALRAIWLASSRIIHEPAFSELLDGYKNFADIVREGRQDIEWEGLLRESLLSIWRISRGVLSPTESQPLREVISRYGLKAMENGVRTNSFGSAVRQPLLPAYGNENAPTSSDSEDDIPARPNEEQFLEEVASHVGDTHVSLRRLGQDVGVGLVQVQANIPITSTHVYWLTEDDMQVISQAIETQVVQLARSLAHARSQMDDRHSADRRQMLRELKEFRTRARRDWYRQVALVKELTEAGRSIEEIAELIGDTEEDVERMLASGRSEVP